MNSVKVSLIVFFCFWLRKFLAFQVLTPISSVLSVQSGGFLARLRAGSLPYSESMKCDIARPRSLPLNVFQYIKNQVSMFLPQGSNETVPNDPCSLT